MFSVIRPLTNLAYGFEIAFEPHNLMWSVFGVIAGSLIGIWVKLLQVPYRYLFPSAMFFIAIGCFSTQNSLFQVGEVAFFGIAGALLVALDFSVAPILLGYILGPMVEGNFRRALVLSQGDLSVFIERPISAWFIGASALLLALQILFFIRNKVARRRAAGATTVIAIEDGARASVGHE
jgi:TctA family transporter